MKRTILRLTVSILCSLVICELVLHIANYSAAYGILIKGVPLENGSVLMTLDSKRLFRFQSRVGDEINDPGFRKDVPAPCAGKKTDHAIAIFGDSFPLGLAVSKERTFPELIQESLNTNSNDTCYSVFNYGVQAYGPDQAYLAFEALYPEKHFDTVILTVFPGNDFSDLERNELISLNQNNELVWRSENSVSRQLTMFKLPMFIREVYSGSPLSTEASEILNNVLFQDYITPLPYNNQKEFDAQRLKMKKMLELFRNQVLTNKSKFIILIIPSYEIIQNPKRFVDLGIPQDKYPLNEQTAVAIASELKIETIDTINEFVQHKELPLFLEEDQHLSVTGHRIVAEKVSSYLSTDNAKLP